MSQPGRIFVVSSPSGGGKHTLIVHAMERMPSLRYSVSATTRKPRAGESDGVHYHFMDRAEFEAARGRGEFLEWAEVHGNLYGTLRSEVDKIRESGCHTVLELDVQGMRQVRESEIEATTIFITPPSIDVLEDRLRKRGTEPPEVMAVRLANAKEEMEAEKEYDHVIVNDDLEDAKAAFLALLKAETQ